MGLQRIWIGNQHGQKTRLLGLHCQYRSVVDSHVAFQPRQPVLADRCCRIHGNGSVYASVVSVFWYIDAFCSYRTITRSARTGNVKAWRWRTASSPFEVFVSLRDLAGRIDYFKISGKNRGYAGDPRLCDGEHRQRQLATAPAS
jgi:hypothetical protein